jgi:hypothetical protein
MAALGQIAGNFGKLRETDPEIHNYFEAKSTKYYTRIRFSLRGMLMVSAH